MAVSRRLRFEVLRRDEHTCRYCGDSGPDVKLTVDHVVPTTLGGSDDPTNLATACQPCNAGKSSIAPNSEIVADVDESALRWSAAMRRAAEIQAARSDERRTYLATFRAAWSQPGPGCYVNRLPDDWEPTIGRFFDMGLEIEVLRDLMRDVLARPYIPCDKVWAYFVTCVRRVLQERQELAAKLIASEASV